MPKSTTIGIARVADAAGSPEYLAGGVTEVHRMRGILDLCSRLSSAAGAQASLQSVIDCLATYTGHSVAIVDPGLTTVVQSSAHRQGNAIAVVRARTGPSELQA
ncbi:hypothetical protein P3H15_53950, partial [Rhodococcus sp. T2V]|uniref:hypothetical protein n=1 Tax=Rhodococcus sp. T2V TaxID=3034164 RepID=UPI0023E14A84